MARPRVEFEVDSKRTFVSAKVSGKDFYIEMIWRVAPGLPYLWVACVKSVKLKYGTKKYELETRWRLHHNGKVTLEQVALDWPRSNGRGRWYVIPFVSIWQARKYHEIEDAVRRRIRWTLLRRLRQRQYLVSRMVLQRKGVLDKDLTEHILSFVFKPRDLCWMIHVPWPLPRITKNHFSKTKEMETSLSPVPVPVVVDTVAGEGSSGSEKQVRFNDDKNEVRVIEKDKKPHEMMDIIDYKDGSDECYSTLNHHLGGIGAKVDGCGGRIDMPWIIAEAVHKMHPNLEFNDELYGFKLRPCTFDCTALIQYIENGRRLQRMIQQDLVAETERCAIKIAGKLEVRGELKRFGRWLDCRARKRQRREEMNEELKRDFGSSSGEEEEDGDE